MSYIHTAVMSRRPQALHKALGQDSSLRTYNMQHLLYTAAIRTPLCLKYPLLETGYNVNDVELLEFHDMYHNRSLSKIFAVNLGEERQSVQPRLRPLKLI
jgi:hypothetical protein